MCLSPNVCIAQVDEVKNIMVDNIERVLERGEKIELLVDKTDNLRFQVCPQPVAMLVHWAVTCVWVIYSSQGPVDSSSFN